MPIPLRYLSAAYSHIHTSIRSHSPRHLNFSNKEQSGFKRTEAKTGAITLIQHFGSDANLSIHLHCLVFDGVYRILKVLVRHVRSLRRGGVVYLAEMETDAALVSLKLVACTHRILTLGSRTGQKVLTL